MMSNQPIFSQPGVRQHPTLHVVSLNQRDRVRTRSQVSDLNNTNDPHCNPDVATKKQRTINRNYKNKYYNSYQDYTKYTQYHVNQCIDQINELPTNPNSVILNQVKEQLQNPQQINKLQMDWYTNGYNYKSNIKMDNGYNQINNLQMAKDQYYSQQNENENQNNNNNWNLKCFQCKNEYLEDDDPDNELIQYYKTYYCNSCGGHKSSLKCLHIGCIESLKENNHFKGKLTFIRHLILQHRYDSELLEKWNCNKCIISNCDEYALPDYDFCEINHKKFKDDSEYMFDDILDDNNYLIESFKCHHCDTKYIDCINDRNDKKLKDFRIFYQRFICNKCIISFISSSISMSKMY